MASTDSFPFSRDLLDSLSDGVYFVDTDHLITFWNRSAERITGFAMNEVMGKSCSDNVLIHVDENGEWLCPGHCPLTKTLNDHQPRLLDLYMRHKNGYRVPVSVRIFPLQDSSGNFVGTAEVFSDSSSKSEMLERLHELNNLAMIDKLTGAASRHFLDIYLKQKLDEHNRYGWPLGLVFFDIDDFKNVNDSYGHEIGDRVLQMFSTTLIKNVRSFDLVGRWGGDEFIVVLSNVNQSTLKEICAKLGTLVANSVIFTGTEEIRIRVSGGATLYKVGDTLEALIARGDSLMYESKSKGKNQITFDGDLDKKRSTI